jgi:hypothetical protein
MSWALRRTYFQSGRNEIESSTRSMIGGAGRRGGPLRADRHEGRVPRNTVPDYGTDAARTKDRVRLVPSRIVGHERVDEAVSLHASEASRFLTWRLSVHCATDRRAPSATNGTNAVCAFGNLKGGQEQKDQPIPKGGGP